jgi:aminoglycoside 6'-N-acetyltransferase I
MATSRLLISLVDARVSETNHTWLTNVYPLYLHDLSEFDEGYYHLDGHGLWKPDHLPSWLNEQEDWPLLIVAEDQRVGFALVNQAPSPHLTPGMDYRMSEFFILRDHRRNRLGWQAAFMVFDRFRGRWELSVLRRNLGAISFWRRILSEYTNGSYTEEIMNDVVCYCFQNL